MSEEFPDMEKAYDEEISPLMRQIIAVCKKHKMPMLASFRFSEDGYCTTVLVGGPDFYESKPLARAVREITNRGEAIALAETRTTQPDGTTHISIRRMA